MRRLLVILVCFLLTACASKRKIVTKSPKPQPKEEVKVVTVSETENKVELDSTIKSVPVINSTIDYIDQFKDAAIAEMKLYGIPASITLAQGILESASGKGRLAVEANNHFGIKCHEWEGDRIYHDDDSSQECFRKYRNAEHSFRDHSEFLVNRKRYGKLFQLDKNDYKSWAFELRSAGYATDKKYPEKLIGLIERYQLHVFDEENETVVTKFKTESHIVTKGDTLYSIAKKYNVSVDDLKKRNKLTSNAIAIGQELVIVKD